MHSHMQNNPQSNPSAAMTCRHALITTGNVCGGLAMLVLMVLTLKFLIIYMCRGQSQSNPCPVKSQGIAHDTDQELITPGGVCSKSG